jgi:hypothetical protein
MIREMTDLKLFPMRACCSGERLLPPGCFVGRIAWCNIHLIEPETKAYQDGFGKAIESSIEGDRTTVRGTGRGTSKALAG